MSIEEKINILGAQVFGLKQVLSEIATYNQEIQQKMWEYEAKQKNTDDNMASVSDTIRNDVNNYKWQSTNGAMKTIDRINTAQSNMSDSFSPRVHVKGEYSMQNDQLWRCKVKNSVKPSNGAEWERVNIAEALIELSQRISALENK